jgi:hypothetical protein
MNNRFLDGIARGLVLGFIASSSIYYVLSGTTGVVQQFWSEQVVSIVTLVAAGIAVWGISRQIQSNVDLAERTRIAKLDAVRSILPIVLHNMVHLCEERFHAVANGNLEKPTGAQWQISDFELATLKSCIEHADGVEKELMLQILRIYQVLISRWDTLEAEDLFNSISVKKYSIQHQDRLLQFNAIRDWIALKATCDALFNYARGVGSEPNKENIKRSVFHTLEYLGSGGKKSGSGWLLTNKKDYDDYVKALIKKNFIKFVDGDWK